MNSTTTPKKTEKVSKTTEAKKTDPIKTDSVKTDIVKTDGTGADNKSDKKPQSASQASISHFSSVSTPEYRQGWDQIFATSKENKSRRQTTKRALPEHLSLTHRDIDATLLNTLNQAFKALAEKQGYDFGQFDDLVNYTITCELKK